MAGPPSPVGEAIQPTALVMCGAGSPNRGGDLATEWSDTATVGNGLRQPRWYRAAVASVVVVGAISVLSGCGSSGTSTTPSTPTATSKTCTSLHDLSKAVSDLLSVPIGAGAVGTISDRLDAVQEALTEVRSTASAQLGNELDAFSSSLNQMRSALTAVTNGSGSITAVQNSIANVHGSWLRLQSAAQNELAGCHLGNG